jgi:hypothetical protein
MSSAASAVGPVVTSEALIAADEGASLDPASISNTNDGGLILTGSMNFNGWAVKTDAKGKVLWRYDLSPETDRSQIQGVRIESAISMLDGSAFACVNMPRALGSKAASALLVHLSSSGQELGKKLIFPASEGRGDGTYRSTNVRCAKWADGFVYVGQESFVASERKFTKIGNQIVFPLDKRFYWIVAFDSSGNVKWERQVPSETASVATIGPLYVLNKKLYFSATDNISTDILKVEDRGTSYLHKNIAGSLSFITPFQAGDGMQMVGYQKYDAFVISLNDVLVETNRTTSIIKDFIGQAYRLNDNSYVIAGSRIHATGETYTTGMVHLDPSFKNPRLMDFPRSKAPAFLDNGRIAAITPSYIDGAFVVVRKLTQVVEANKPIDAPPMLRGAVLDFVQVN